VNLENIVYIKNRPDGIACISIEKDGNTISEAEFKKGKFVIGYSHAVVPFEARGMTLVKWPCIEESIFYAFAAARLGADPSDIKEYISQKLSPPKPI